MSTRAKVIFASSIIGAITVIPGVHWMQAEQREVIRQGPIKDSQRRARMLTSEQQCRVTEYEEQKMLREKYSSDQKVSSVEDIKGK